MYQPTVLIADDDVQMRRSLLMRLEASGYRVIECRDGLGVIAKSRSLPVDVMILDHEMPLGEGRRIADCIRETSDTPIIFLSGHDRESFRDTIMRLPHTYFLSKPFDNEKLQALLRSLVRAPKEATA